MKKFEWYIWGNVKIVLHLIDIDPSDKRIQIGIELAW